ncbi:MAG: hypothetical protein ABIH47_09085 [Candidatus Omnitrophota bacterium]
MRKKTKKEKVSKSKQEVKSSRNALMLAAKERGVKNFRVLNKEELRQVLAEAATQEKIDKIVACAVARWKAGWGSRKDKKK